MSDCVRSSPHHLGVCSDVFHRKGFPCSRTREARCHGDDTCISADEGGGGGGVGGGGREDLGVRKGR